jgi:hypothetical protein
VKHWSIHRFYEDFLALIMLAFGNIHLLYPHIFERKVYLNKVLQDINHSFDTCTRIIQNLSFLASILHLFSLKKVKLSHEVEIKTLAPGFSGKFAVCLLCPWPNSLSECPHPNRKNRLVYASFKHPQSLTNTFTAAVLHTPIYPSHCHRLGRDTASPHLDVSSF